MRSLAARAPAIDLAHPAGSRRGIGRVLPGLLALLVAAVAVLDFFVCQSARIDLVGNPALVYDTLVRLIALDLGFALAGILALGLWHRREIARIASHEADARLGLARALRVFDNAFEPILTFDARGRVHAVNRAATTLFARPAEQMIGEPIHRFLACGTVAEGGAFAPAALETVAGSVALCADGSVVPVEFSLTCAGEDEGRAYTVVIRDISERVRADGRIRSIAEGLEVTNRRLEEANAQLEEASKLKSEFLANTSHELRTPLNGMIGFLQLVLDGMCDTPEEEREFLLQALQCSRHLLGLINDVLDIAKIEAGKLALDIESVDPRALFGEVYTVTHVQAAQKGLTLKFEPPENATFSVRGDFGKVKQVLINLISNSLKFTSRGSITVSAAERPDLGHFLFEVIDTGIGIPLDRQKFIFEKFTQGDGSTTRKYGGAGLGLAINRSLVELMGGIIGVESEGPGKGTRMYFSLPLWRPGEEEGDGAAVEARVPDRIEGPAGGPLVLVVEDDSVFRQFLAALLHRCGYRTVEAGHAEGGWVLVRRLRPSVVVLDYALACADGASLRTGWDLAERMTTDPRTRHIPLIFVTGFDLMLKERLRSTVLSRPPEHLMKPVDGSVLVAKIEEVIGKGDGVVRVLMADDDPSVSAYVRKVLPEERFHIEVANNGEECLHILRTQPRGFDLLLLDLMMPDVSGYDVLRELSIGQTADLPVLILTNFPEARDDEEKRLLERGLVLDVIAKSSVHENPMLLQHIIDWHMQVAQELGTGATGRDGDPSEAPLSEAA